ncbi:hypothetical protein KC901_01125 [Patescibacteria group bacterium]|nr:hypothetical protein [Patescibacteria group bacterium]
MEFNFDKPPKNKNNQEDSIERKITLEKLLGLSKEIIKDRLLKLGIEIKNEFPDRVDVVLGSSSQFAPPAGCAAYAANTDIVVLDKDFNLHKINHELLHAYSSKYRYDERNWDDVADDLNIYDKSIKSGFATEYLKNGIYEKATSTNFAQINEAITEKMNVELLSENKDKIENKGLFADPGKYYFYQEEILLLEMMLDGIAMSKSKNKDDVSIEKEKIWQELQKAYFSGNTMFLRVFDKVYDDKILREFNELDFKSEDYEQRFKDLRNKLIEKNLEMKFEKELY